MTKPDNDIVREFVRRLEPYAPPEELRLVEIALRAKWGGERVYIPKKEPLSHDPDPKRRRK